NCHHVARPLHLADAPARLPTARSVAPGGPRGGRGGLLYQGRVVARPQRAAAANQSDRRFSVQTLAPPPPNLARPFLVGSRARAFRVPLSPIPAGPGGHADSGGPRSQ